MAESVQNYRNTTFMGKNVGLVPNNLGIPNCNGCDMVRVKWWQNVEFFGDVILHLLSVSTVAAL